MIPLAPKAARRSLLNDQPPILIVDDDPVNCEVLRRILERGGHPVGVANNGAEALHQLQPAPDAAEFSLVLLDIRMPGMNGIDVLKAIRKQFSARELPVIMVTGEEDSGMVVRALDSGANDYITKPVEFSVLAARVRTQLSQKLAHKSLSESEERYALAARGANDALWDLDLQSGVLYFGPRWGEMLGYPDQEISPTLEFWASLVHVEDRERFLHCIEEHCSRQTPRIEGEFRLTHRDGTWRWVLIRGMAIWNAEGRATRVAGSQTDITESRAQDPLTGLPNRLQFRERVTAALERFRRSPEDKCAVLFFDLDRFKTINDSLGHRAGDEMLIEVARRLGLRLRPERDLLARFGGDEFALLLTGFREEADVSRVAERLLRDINQPLLLSGYRVMPRASLGIAIAAARETCDSDDLIHNADTAMYAAKGAKTGSFAIFSQAMRQAAFEKLTLEHDLRAAINSDQMRLVFQSQVNLASGKITGFEALLRWMHPRRGLMMPNTFVPLAEATGTIVEIGAWVMREAAQQLVAWNAMFPANQDLAISVNVSPAQLGAPGFCDLLLDILAQTHVPASRLKLELIEAVFLDPEMTGILEEVKSLGFSLKMDDFGTGYCSLADLTRTRFEAIKIDRSFVKDIETSSEAKEIVNAIIALGNSLCMKVVAEGIETASQAKALKALGCEYGQGYLYSKPVAVELAQELLDEQENTANCGKTLGLLNKALVPCS